MDLLNKKCVSYEGGVLQLTEKNLNFYLRQVNGWELIDDGKKIKKEFKFKNFKEALNFVNKIGEIAEQESHHPDFELS